MGKHSGGSGLAVRAGHRDQALRCAKLGQQLTAVDDALSAIAGGDQLWIVLGHRCRDDDLGVVGDRVRVVAHTGLKAGGPQALEVGALRAVRARDLGPEAVTEQREAAHPGAADGYEVELAVVPGRHRRAARRIS